MVSASFLVVDKGLTNSSKHNNYTCTVKPPYPVTLGPVLSDHYRQMTALTLYQSMTANAVMTFVNSP